MVLVRLLVTDVDRSLPSRTENITNVSCPADIGAAYGTAKSGVGISSMGVMNVCSTIIFPLFVPNDAAAAAKRIIS